MVLIFPLIIYSLIIKFINFCLKKERMASNKKKVISKASNSSIRIKKSKKNDSSKK